MPSVSTKENTDNIFESTLAPRPVTKFTLMRGVTDYTNLSQFDLYETGYSFLISLQIPRFMTVLANSNDSYLQLIKNYRHIIEYDFRGLQGIEDITSETNALTNGISDLNVITRVTEQPGSTFTMQYFERSGSLITKTHELFLRGVKDPRTQVKRYNGLLQKRFSRAGAAASNKLNDKGFEYEVFHYMLIVTDNTALNVEKAYIIASAQPSQANTGNLYNVTRGDIQFQELALQYNGYPISGRIVNEKACDFLDWINDNTCFDEMQFGYNILASGKANLGKTGTVMLKSPTIGNGLTGPEEDSKYENDNYYKDNGSVDEDEKRIEWK